MFHGPGLPWLDAGAGPAVVRRACLAACLVLAAALPGAGEEAAEEGGYLPYSGIERGTEGVFPVALTIENATGAPLLCHAALAHWYSAPLGQAGPGATLAVTLWHDPETGELSLLNATEDRMPVERIACGPEGAPHAAPLSLPFRAGPAPARLARRCAAGADGVVCRAKKAD